MMKAILFLDEHPGKAIAPTRYGVADISLDAPFKLNDEEWAEVFRVFKDPKGGIPTVYARKVG